MCTRLLSVIILEQTQFNLCSAKIKVVFFAVYPHATFTIDQRDIVLHFPFFPPLPLSLSFSLSLVLQKVSPQSGSSSLCSPNTVTLSHTHTHAERKIRHPGRQAGCKSSVIDLSAACFRLIYYPADSSLTPALVTVYCKSLS